MQARISNDLEHAWGGTQVPASALTSHCSQWPFWMDVDGTETVREHHGDEMQVNSRPKLRAHDPLKA